MISLSTVKDSGHKLSPHSDVREGDTGEGDIMQSKQQKKRRLRIGAWNVRTLLQVGKFEGRNEKKQSGELISDEFRMFYSSGNAKGNHGVGVVLGSRARDKLISVRYVDKPVMVVRLQGKKVDLVMVQIYMPHSRLANEEVEETYDKREEIVEKEKTEEQLEDMDCGKGTREVNPW